MKSIMRILIVSFLFLAKSHSQNQPTTDLNMEQITKDWDQLAEQHKSIHPVAVQDIGDIKSVAGGGYPSVITNFGMTGIFNTKPALNATPGSRNTTIVDDHNTNTTKPASTAGETNPVLDAQIRATNYHTKVLEEDNVRAAYVLYVKRQLDYHSNAYAIKEKAIKDTNRTANVIFWVTHVMLVVGFTISVLEFRKSNQLRARGSEMESQELELSLEGLALKTSLNGAFIFILTIVLYFLYIKFVMPIETV